MEFDLSGVNDLDNTLRKALKGMDDFKKPLEESGVYMYQSIDKNFQSQGRPVKWKKHHWITNKLRPNGRILEDTGHLKQSITSRGSGSKYILGKRKLTIGSNVKARGSSRLLLDIQQNGLPAGVNKVFGTPGKNGIPARPVLFFQDEDTEMIKRIFTDYAKGLFK